MTEFEVEIQVRFEHVDVAGIVFYARYFEMLSEVHERFIEHVSGLSYRALHQVEHRGVPLVDVHCSFKAPSYLSDKLLFRVSVTRLGTSSMELRVRALCGDEPRLEAEMTIVHIRNDGQGIRSLPFPADMVERVQEFGAW